MVGMAERRWPHRADFSMPQNRSFIDIGTIPHTAQSLFHDHAPANHFGLASAWTDRRHGDQGSGATMPPPGTPKYNFRFDSMADLVLAHQTELRPAGA